MPALIEDKFAIEELIGRYNQSIDQGHYAEFLACWCDDGIFDGLGGPYVGIEAIRQFTDGYDERYRLRLNGLKHFTVNVVSRIDGDKALSCSHLQLVSTGTSGARILFTARYQDELRRTPEGWRFTRRKLHQDVALPEPSVNAVEAQGAPRR